VLPPRSYHCVKCTRLHSFNHPCVTYINAARRYHYYRLILSLTAAVASCGTETGSVACRIPSTPRCTTFRWRFLQPKAYSLPRSTCIPYGRYMCEFFDNYLTRLVSRCKLQYSLDLRSLKALGAERSHGNITIGQDPIPASSADADTAN